LCRSHCLPARPERALALATSAAAWLLLPGLLAAQSASAGPCTSSRGPLPIGNESPLRQPFYHARPTSACAASDPTLELRVLAANQFFDGRQGSRWAFLDAETYRLDLAASLPLRGGRELRIEAPFHSRGTGILDGPIELWHDLLRLPRGTRVDYARNRLRFLIGSDALSRDVHSLLAESDRAAGMGDVTITLLQGLPSAGGSATAIRGGIKLPTGRPSDFFGSGGTDWALGLAWTREVAAGLWLHTNFDMVILGRPKLPLTGISHEETASRFLLGLEWQARSRTRVLVQGLTETSPLELGISYLDRESLLLALGVRQSIRRGMEVELAIAEDLRTQTAPDFALQAGVRWVFLGRSVIEGEK
jgi:hypothetical protein